MAAPEEDLPVTVRYDVYPAIDPTHHFVNQSFKGKVVFISGASRGIGEEIAITYAKAGASIAISARKQETLDGVKHKILEQAPSADVLAVTADVKDAKEVAAAVAAAYARFGRLDICMANAGASDLCAFTQQDPEVWWNTVEVNIRGVFNVAHAAVPHLVESKGYFIATTSEAAQMRYPRASSYSISKHAIGRFIEFVTVENPGVKAFALHPGRIPTELTSTHPEVAAICIDTLQLPAAAALHLTSGKADWLSGRYVSAEWDVDEMEEWKDRIVETNGLVTGSAERPWDSVYPAIDPQVHYRNQTYRGKVVFITGASRGIGEETALTYAKAGASVVLAARKQETLDGVKNTILAQVPFAEVLTIPTDVKETKQVEAAIKATIDRFGRLDICIANAGKGGRWDQTFAEQDPYDWWDTQEINVRGTYNTAHFAVPHLVKTKGYLIVVSSLAAQFLWPNGSAYGLSKHTLGRFVEFVALEYPDVKVFSLHPGGIKTQTSMENPDLVYNMLDTVQLPAATMLYMTSGKSDWLSGKYVSANWDVEEMERQWKDKIVEKGGLVSKLYIPKL
ncbi:hypothetical protein EWM64_g3945 [Hericium alpestre]|uniref:Uncharacterized protein n=1 Tax=Hericium alpestre TaxID=135208 RepID=A0A4Y9ZZ07_9AGAM|nr:hypothetical protein EWM64_g3945 [Hericium alpestre]